MVLLLLVVATGTLALATIRAQAAASLLEDVQSDLAGSARNPGRLEEDLRRAEQDFDRALDLTSGWWLAPLGQLPVLGVQLESFQSLAAAGSDLAGGLAHAVARSQALVDLSLPPGPQRAASLREFARIVEDITEVAAEVDLGPDGYLIPPLAGARERLTGELESLLITAASAQGVLTAVADLLEGPSRLLLLSSNNAEMRVGSGMYLAAGLLTVQDGAITLGDLLPASQLVLPEGVEPVDTDLWVNWSWAEPNRDFRSLGLSPRFEVSADLASRMWVAGGGEPVDGVLAIDVVGLRLLLEATGPLRLSDGTVVDEDNVVELLTFEQYTDVVVGPGFDEAESARRELQAEVAAAALEAVGSADLDIGELAAAILRSVAGRHIMLWSSDPDTTAIWASAGVGGTIGPESISVNVANNGQSKLDPFLEVTADLQVVPDGPAQLATLEVRLANRAPNGLPPYIGGFGPGGEPTDGVYEGRIVITLPRAATSISLGDGLEPEVLGADGEALALGIPVRLPPGDETTVTTRFALPDGFRRVEVIPSARIPAVVWSIAGSVFSDDVARHAEW